MCPESGLHKFIFRFGIIVILIMISPQTICGIFDSNAFESCETGKAACRWVVSLNRASFTFSFQGLFHLILIGASFTFVTFCGPLSLSHSGGVCAHVAYTL